MSMWCWWARRWRRIQATTTPSIVMSRLPFRLASEPHPTDGHPWAEISWPSPGRTHDRQRAHLKTACGQIPMSLDSHAEKRRDRHSRSGGSGPCRHVHRRMTIKEAPTR